MLVSRALGWLAYCCLAGWLACWVAGDNGLLVLAGLGDMDILQMCGVLVRSAYRRLVVIRRFSSKVPAGRGWWLRGG